VATNRTQASGLRPMSDLSDYRIEPGDPDPRGWTVVGTDDHPIGTVVDLLVDTSAMKVRQLLVDTDSNREDGNSLISLDVSEVDVREGERHVLARGYVGQGFDTSAHRYAGAYSSSTGTAAGEERLTRSEEELAIGKRKVTAGEARIGKHVETEHISQPVTRRREEVVVERRPVEAGARGDAATIGDAEVRVPLMEEEVTVEKRPVVKEELVVGKRVVEDRDQVEAEVRREEFDIDERVEAASRDRSGRGDER
jgi:uncharacterized protein (TIGR02271 family)